MQDQDAHTETRRGDPIFSSTMLHRKELVKRLNEELVGPAGPVPGKRATRYKLLMLCAPAGYGKTTLLSDFAFHTSIPCCWCFLEPADADPLHFLTSLLLSIRARFADFGKQLDELFEQASAPEKNPLSTVSVLSDMLTRAIDKEIPGRHVIFLCGYHEVNASQEVNKLMNYFLRRLSSHCTLVLESRAIPAFDFALLLARDEVIGFDHTFFKFTAAELQELAQLRGVGSFTEREAQQLADLFGGWIAGMLLGTRLGDTHTLRARKDIYTCARMPEVQIDRTSLLTYVVNEVFHRDLEMYTFLKKISILPQITPVLCDMLLEMADGMQHLQYLERQGLFVTGSGDGPQAIYTCHPVLQELLCDELRRQNPELFVMLHRRAMDYWQSVHNYEQAIYHAFEAKLDIMAASLILEAHEELYAQGYIVQLARWIDALASEVLALHPKLLVVRANIYLLSSEHTRALPLLTMASEQITQQPAFVNEEELLLLQSAIAIARSKILFQIGDYQQAQKLCEQVIEELPSDEVELLAEAYMCLGGCGNMLGDLAGSIAHRQKALHLWGRNSERRQTAELHSALARTYGLTGMFALAEHHLMRATKCWDRLHDDWGRANTLLNIGLIKYLQGEFPEAEASFQKALAIARGPIHFYRGEAYALVNLGELYQDQELYEQSLAFMEDGLALARQLQDRYLINYALCILAITYLLMGDASTAMFLVSEADAEAVHSKSSGDEKVRRELTRGRIFLYQQQYEKAYACLAELETSLRVSGLQWELLCTTLRLAECLLIQGALPEAIRRLDEMATLILRNDYEQTVLRELRLLPHLEDAIRTRPELVRLRTILQAEITASEKLEELPVVPKALPEVVPLPEALPAETSSERSITENHQIKIIALGEPAILIDGKPVTRWRMARAMELFFFLLDSGRPLRKEQIITALWPETDEHVNQTLHSTIHYLRKSLGDACIASHAGTYWLDMVSLYGQEYWYDVAAFQVYDVKAKEALAASNDAGAKAILLSMVDLYRGDYVQSFYSNWCSFRRDKLRLLYLDARQQLALIAWRNEQFDESAAHWHHILAVDSCMEGAHYGLMRYYMRQGKRGLALRQYQRCVEVLRRDLNVEPGTAIQNLVQHLSKAGGSR